MIVRSSAASSDGVSWSGVAVSIVALGAMSAAHAASPAAATTPVSAGAIEPSKRVRGAMVALLSLDLDLRRAGVERRDRGVGAVEVDRGQAERDAVRRDVGGGLVARVVQRQRRGHGPAPHVVEPVALADP